MANYKKDKNKWIAVGVAVVLLACTCITTIVMGVKNNGWFKKDEGTKIEQPNNQPPATSDAGGMEIGEGNNNGVSLLSAKIAPENYAVYGVSPQAESAYTLTATITPADASNKSLDWTIAFSNPNSTWATGKTVTDYVTVTPSADGALTAVVENKAAFGEQIIVKCTSRDNSSANATCIVEYLQRVEYKFQLAGKTYSVTGTNLVTPTFVTETKGLKGNIISAKSTVYTRANTESASRFVIRPTESFKTAITNAGFTAANLKEYIGDGDTAPVSHFFDGAWCESLYSNDTEKNQLIDALVAFSGNAYEIGIYNASGIKKLETLYITLDTSVIETQRYVAVEGVEFDQTEIVF